MKNLFFKPTKKKSWICLYKKNNYILHVPVVNKKKYQWQKKHKTPRREKKIDWKSDLLINFFLKVSLLDKNYKKKKKAESCEINAIIGKKKIEDKST